MNKTIIIFSIACILAAGPAFCQEEVEYKKFKLEEASCDVGIHYVKTKDGMRVLVSAIATGKGTEFRKWEISSIKLRLGEKRYKPDSEGKFYVNEESLFRVPGAVVLAAIVMIGGYDAHSFGNTITNAGVGLGMGIIALQAKGEITGARCYFDIASDDAENIKQGADAIEITVQNQNLHLSDTIKIGLVRPSELESAKKYDFSRMSEVQLLDLADSLKDRIAALEKEQSAYKYGRDAEYDDIQRRIESFETERGMAYKEYLERRKP